MIQIYDNLMDSVSVQELEKICRDQIPFFIKNETYPDHALDRRLKSIDKSRFSNLYYMAHHLVFGYEQKSEMSVLSDRLLHFFCEGTGFKYKKVICSRINLTFPRQNILPTMPHVDHHAPHKTIIYYVNNTDGNTILYNDDVEIIKEIEPVAGRIALFDGNILHSVGLPQKDIRIIFNINVEV